MSVANKLSRSIVANGGFGDPDLTPKPLRISKREQVRTSTAGTINPPLSIHLSQTQGNLQALAPSRKCSTRINSTQLDLSLRDPTAPTSQWARRNTFLHVHKQRQSEPINTNTALLTAASKESIESIGFSPVDYPARSRNSCPTMSQLGSSSDASKAVVGTRPTSIRAFTAGTYSRQNPLSPVHEVSSSLSALSAPQIRQRRAVTNGETSYKDLNGFVSLPHRITQKQIPTKNSLVSRVMSGLTNRNHVSHSASRGGYDATSDFTPAALSRAQENNHTYKQSDSSSETDTYCERNFHHVRAAYPTPPTSRATSSTTVESLDTHHSIMPQRFRELCKPSDAVLMGAELTLTPECDDLSSEQEQSMWVSLDIKGTTNSTSSVQDVWSQHTGLDIVVVIDNSLHTSPAALMASCETARFLASILNRVTDRLAILCTSVTHTGDSDSTIIRYLSDVHLDMIKSDLDAIASSHERIKTNDWINAIDCAKEILLNSTVPDPDEELLQDTFGHIFLLTPDAGGLPSHQLAHDELTFHVICPASVPRNDQAPIHCSGWQLRSLSGNITQVVSKRKDHDPTSVTNRLRVLIAQARTGTCLGNLTELVLEISGGPGCTVEGVMGNVEFVELHPGEVFTVLFRLTIRGATVQEDSLPGTPTFPLEALPNNHNVLSELDKIHSATTTKILTARLIYRHSLLPAGTTCTVTTDCHVERRPRTPDEVPTPSTLNFLPARNCTLVVDKRLAYHLATQCSSPRTALKTLHKQFGDTFQSSACRDYLNLLATELKYQARISERLELDASPRKKKPPAISPPRSKFSSSPDEKWTRTPSSSSSSHNNPDETHKNNNDRHIHRNTSDIPTEELFEPEPALAVLSLKESREKLRTDEARRIWGDLRKMGRLPDDGRRTTAAAATTTGKGSGGKGSGRSISSSQAVEEEEARKVGIRELAVRNKRSVGTETLRSLFSVGESVGKGFGAPWL